MRELVLGLETACKWYVAWGPSWRWALHRQSDCPALKALAPMGRALEKDVLSTVQMLVPLAPLTQTWR